MTKEKAIQLLRAIQEPEAWELPITQDAYLALDMAIEELKIKDMKEKHPVTPLTEKIKKKTTSN